MQLLQEEAQHKKTCQRLQGALVAAAGLTTGIICNSIALMLALPPLSLALFILWLRKTQKNDTPTTSLGLEDPLRQCLEKHLAQAQYDATGGFAEKNTLELQAFGNEMYMKSSEHITGICEGVPYKQYNLELPDFFMGRSMLFTLATPFLSKVFIIKRDFPHSQLLTGSGHWQQIPTGSAHFDAQYATFTKEPEHLSKTLTESIQYALLNLDTAVKVSQCYYMEGQELYVLLPRVEEQVYSQDGYSSEEQISMLKKDMLIVTSFLQLLNVEQ